MTPAPDPTPLGWLALAGFIALVFLVHRVRSAIRTLLNLLR